MRNTLNNIFTSVATSLIVSSVTFTLGLKSGKNQSDRQNLRNKYREISVHFSELLNGIEGINPKKWSDYKTVKNPSGGEYCPLMREMKFNGQSIELKQKIINNCEDLEFRLMKYSNNYYNLFKEIEQYIVDQLEKECSCLIKESDYYIGTTKQVGKYFREYNYGVFIINNKFENMIKNIKTNTIQGICLKNKDKTLTVDIYKDTLNDISIEEFLENIYKYYKNNQDVANLLDERNKLIQETENIIRMINKRVKDPSTFIETIIGAITDIFKL